jgi:hypothetical protein
LLKDWQSGKLLKKRMKVKRPLMKMRLVLADSKLRPNLKPAVAEEVVE